AVCDGEVFSNLHFTQAVYDALKAKGDINAPISDIRSEAATVAEQLLHQEPVRKQQMIFGEPLEELLAEVAGIYQDEAKLQATLAALYQQTQTYAETYGAIAKDKKGKKS
ncbi:MAG: type I-D CRISPR-associated protein Cas7/Csc2, partial [Leptolyngbyaceae cyanobacterium SM1_4_3]|nr:type I-D CRISPR-associated protein Cas7/Csc2 [Leptolyngbyaceae cyanobacterium SM1_4_3]